MFLRKILFLGFLILYEILTFVNPQEYLKELQPKDIKVNINDELPPVEIPRPIVLQRQARSQDTEISDEWEDRQHKSQRPTLLDIALKASVSEGLNAMRRLYSVIEPDMVKNGHVLQDNHPAALLSKFSAPVGESTRREMAAYATLTATKAFRKNYNLSNDLARQAHTHKVSLRRTALESLCPPRDSPTCMPASERYRTHDGTCNNRRRLRWGAAQMPFNRFLPPEYGDGVDSTRSSADGAPLSSSRFVSLLVHGAREGEAPLTLMLAQWGQLLDHDLTSTAQPRSFNGSVPSCCGNKDFHPSCFPIKVPLDDPWLSPLKVRCLEFLRSAPAQRRDCVLSWREQTNQVTSYLDASPIYASNVKSSDNARTFRNGLLIFGRGNPADDVCQRGAIATHCIRSGDGRSGEQPGLLALHHVWVHEHNHIAMKLSEMNLHWSDEKIYQETRRIIGAMFQHITYREFLPIVLGREVAKLFDLELLNSGYFEGYDPKTNPTVANAFAAAAFRFGHSLVQNSYMRCDRFHNVMNNNVSLHEEFQRGDIGSVGSLHRLIRGMASQRALKRDEFITPELTNHLFQTPGFPFGLDLAAINIQRGRDHGVPPYTHWRVPCGLTPITTWEEFANVVGPESARRISHAYHSVHDIDLFVGGISERPVVGGLVGPTFACIIAQQFSNSRKGDRFWYENAGFESSFTPAQLHAVRRVSLASVLCRAVGGGTFQPHIFLPPEFPNNERLPCGVGPLADFDISPWLELDPFNPPIEQQPPPPNFKPQHLPDRVFDIMELETKSPVDSVTPISDNKVGFSNRVPPITNIKDAPSFTQNSGTVNQRFKNGTRINDKLDIKKKGTQGHVTKQKPVPAINSKLDKNNRKGSHRHGLIQTTTRRTIIVNNIPIELRNAGLDNSKISSINKNVQTEDTLEPRTEDSELITERTKNTEKIDRTEIKLKLITENTVNLKRRTDAKETEKITKQTETTTDNTWEGRTNNFEITEQSDGSKLTEIHLKLETEHTTDNTLNLNRRTDDIKITKHAENTNQSKMNSTTNTSKNFNNLNTRTTDLELPTPTIPNNNKYNIEANTNPETKEDNVTVPTNLKVTEQNSSDLRHVKLKRIGLTLTNTTRLSDGLFKTNDYDIDPMIHSTPPDQKRVQRTLTTPATTKLLADKANTSKNFNNLDTRTADLGLPTPTIQNNNKYNIETNTKTETKEDNVTVPTKFKVTEQNSSDSRHVKLKRIGLTLTKTTRLSDGLFKTNDSDIDPMIHSTPPDHKRVQRTLTHPATAELLTDKANTSKNFNNLNTRTADLELPTPTIPNNNKYNIETNTKTETKQDNVTVPTNLEMTEQNSPDSRHVKLKQIGPTLTKTTRLSDGIFKTNDSDIDPMIHSTPPDHKRVQRTLTPPATAELLTDKAKFSALKNLVKSNISAITNNRTLTTKTPRPNRTTLRNIELRQYHNRPLYTKPPQKVIVDSVNGDNQYQIEINIRQTNKSPKPLQSTPHVVDYTNGYKINPYDRYTANYQTYTSTTPIYPYYQPAPTQVASLPQNDRTKPPTIIFLNEHEHDRTTTRQPGFLQNIVGWNLGNKHPLPQSIGVNERPGYESVISSPHSPASVQPAYQKLRPSTQDFAPAGTSSFSQAQLGGGIVQASSTSVSNGNFGSISGFASANEADSTFSFNIRHKPDKHQNQRPETIHGGGLEGSYGLAQPQRNPWYTQKPEYISLPIATNEHVPAAYDLPYRENVLSPFSTSNSQTHYIRNKYGPQRKAALTLAQSQEFTNYDYTSRTLQPLHNLTSSEENDDVDIRIDPEYDEDYGTSSLIRKFNQDGYLRPEHMIDTLVKSKAHTTNNSPMTDANNNNNQNMDDNYVLPVLNISQKLPVDPPTPLNTNFSTDFPDSVGKHLNNDIFAEHVEAEEDKLIPDKTNALQEHKQHNRNRNKNNIRNREKIAFAPINVLTKPERPDNWVIYDSPKEEPLLPQTPELTMDPIPSAEVPKPFKENNMLDVTNLKLKLALQLLESSEHLLKRLELDAKPPVSNENIFGKTEPIQTNWNIETLDDSTEKT